MASKALPIIMSGPMVRATLARQKRETRRTEERWNKRSPGDLLYVRETWCVSKRWDQTKPRDIPKCAVTVMFAEGGSVANVAASVKLASQSTYALDRHWPACGERPKWAGKLRPSIFLPAWASRITLRIRSIRDERLHKLSLAGFMDEGGEATPTGYRIGTAEASDYRDAFAELWDGLRGAGSWAENPLVHVIRFDLIEKNFALVLGEGSGTDHKSDTDAANQEL